MINIEDIAFTLLKRSPFYANLFRNCKITLDNTMPYPAAVVVKNSLEIFLNAELMSKMSLKTQAGVLEHEFQHLLKNHIGQYKNKSHFKISQKLNKKPNGQALNMAFDAEINCYNQAFKDDPERGLDSIIRAKKLENKLKHESNEFKRDVISRELQEIIDKNGFIFPEFFNEKPGYDWQYYYAVILSNANVQDKIDKYSGTSESNPGNCHDYFEKSSDNQDLMDEIVYKTVKEAAKRLPGNLPGEVGKYISDFEKKQALPWTTILRQLIHKLISINKRINWKKINRRFPEILPGYKKEPKLKVLVGLDASGSFGDDDWKDSINEIYAIKAEGVDIWIAEFDTQITNYYRFESVHKPRSSYGGTSFEPVHKKALECGFNVVIMLTDGHADFMDPKTITYQCIWIMSSDIVAPYGTTIRLPTSKKRSY